MSREKLSEAELVAVFQEFRSWLLTQDLENVSFEECWGAAYATGKNLEAQAWKAAHGPLGPQTPAEVRVFQEEGARVSGEQAEYEKSLRDAQKARIDELEKLNKQNAGVESQMYAGFQYTIRRLQAAVASMREALDLKELSEDAPRAAQRIRELKSERDRYKVRARQAVDVLANTTLSAEQRIHEVLVIFLDTET